MTKCKRSMTKPRAMIPGPAAPHRWGPAWSFIIFPCIIPPPGRRYTRPLMLELSRTVRFCLSPDPGDAEAPRRNTFAAWPPMRGLGRYYELKVTCRGTADPQTGYFINIKQIDTAVREAVLPQLRRAVANEAAAARAPVAGLLAAALDALQPALSHSVQTLELWLCPTLSYTLSSNPGRDTMTQVLLKQQYEFSAAHRLHVPAFSDEENRATFGKCNNPAGHGHNYRVEVVASCPVDAHGRTLEPAKLDAAVDEHLIEVLDHTHLNVDVPAFAALNPSVEHIAVVAWGMLKGKLPGGATLHEVSVWETGKTVCTYRGG